MIDECGLRLTDVVCLGERLERVGDGLVLAVQPEANHKGGTQASGEANHTDYWPGLLSLPSVLRLPHIHATEFLRLN